MYYHKENAEIRKKLMPGTATSGSPRASALALVGRDQVSLTAGHETTATDIALGADGASTALPIGVNPLANREASA